jgi:hypothetical protein
VYDPISATLAGHLVILIEATIAAEFVKAIKHLLFSRQAPRL